MDVTTAIKAGMRFSELQGFPVGSLETVQGHSVGSDDEFWDARPKITSGLFFMWAITFYRIDGLHTDSEIVYVVVNDQTGVAVFGKNIDALIRLPKKPIINLERQRLQKDEAVKLAIDFANNEGIETGEVLNILYDPICRIHELWDASMSTSKHDRFQMAHYP